MKPMHLILPILLFISSCAKMSYSPKFYIKNNRERAALEDIADKMKWSEAKDIKVLIRKTPKGVRISKNGKVIITNKRRYRYLGKVYAKFNEPSLLGLYTYPEDQKGREGLCHFQTALAWMTLGIWALSPTYYPCFVSDSSNDKDEVLQRRNRMIKTMKKMTKALGGHILVVSSLSTLKDGGDQVNSVAASGHAIEIIGRK